MSKPINTELPLDFDYFHNKENEDTETVRQFLEEYNRVGGITCSYYVQTDASLDVDTIFMEKINKTFFRPIKVKFILEYIQEVIENQMSGIQILDTMNFMVEMEYFKNTVKSKPKVGDLMMIDYAGLMFEITNVIDAEAVLFGQKFTWKITGKIYIESHEDKNVTNDVHEPGHAPGEEDNFNDKLNDNIEEESDEEYQYNDGDNPFDPDRDSPFGEY